ncbi:MAG: hypothetical protein N3F04_05475 [Candidatus Nezhaarchaeota archaeon]|nr:hypothetical protein [Candidatus Nezhaarchaeota archaeon]MCX8142192.1 hypothetical protein [Candidatus Nezhaarchaeota archaeon]MDW8050025.1 hypothetical protein [Nitrososphaerota archaeon]
MICFKIPHGKPLNRRGISPAVSTAIITTVLLILLAIASAFAINMLEIQAQNIEFEQAKTTMLILDKTIIDVSLRRGAASTIAFNQRSGGIGIYEGEKMSMTISCGNLSWNRTITPYIIKYRGGSMVSAVEVNLTDPGGLIVNDPSKPLGYVRIEVEDGAWIVLDYNRVRVTINKRLGTMDVYFIRLKPGVFADSDTVTVRAQNKGINMETMQLGSSAHAHIYVRVGGHEGAFTSDVAISTINVIEVIIEVSIT